MVLNARFGLTSACSKVEDNSFILKNNRFRERQDELPVYIAKS